MSIQLVDNFVVSAADDPQIAYSSPETQNTVIDSFTASNVSSVNASYRAYIVSSTGEQKAQIPLKIVVWGENDLGIGVVNQVIPKGGSLLLESSATDSIYFTLSGRLVGS